MIISLRYIMVFSVCLFVTYPIQAQSIQKIVKHAIKDTARVSVGAGIGAAVAYLLQQLNDPSLINAGIMNAQVLPTCIIIGAACGGFFTSYAKSLRAQLGLRNVDKQLVGLVMQAAYGKTPGEVVDDLQDYYVKTGRPLIIAVAQLTQQDDYLGVAIELIQAIVDELPEDSERRLQIAQWLDDLSTMRIYVRYAVTFIKKDPRYLQMIAGLVA